MSDDFNIDYTSKDYASLVQAADAFALSILPEWTSRDDNDINWATIKTVAYLVSIGMFYIDFGVNEQDPFEVQVYRNAIRLARKFGMPIRKVAGAVTTLDITVVAHESPLVIPRGTEFIFQSAAYILWEDAVFATTELTKTVDVQYGLFERYQLGISDASEFQFFEIARTDVQNQRIRILVNETGDTYIVDPDGFVEWTSVDTLVMSYKEDNHYRLVLNEAENYEARFGDNKSGRVPPDGSVIVVEVLTIPLIGELDNLGNLPAGNIEASSDSNVETVVQVSDATGGQVKENLDSIARAIPQWIAASNRGVSEEDFVFLARRISGVIFAAAEIIDTVVNVFIVGKGGTSPALLSKVKDYVSKRSLPLYSVNILQGIDEDITSVMSIVVKDDFSQILVKDNVVAAVEKFIESIIGEDINVMNLYGVVAAVEGVKSAVITALYKSLDTPGLGDISLEVNKIGKADVITVVASGGVI